jgi:hypothetical protein
MWLTQLHHSFLTYSHFDRLVLRTPQRFIPPTVSHNNRETIKQIEEIKLTLYKFKKYDYVL